MKPDIDALKESIKARGQIRHSNNPQNKWTDPFKRLEYDGNNPGKFLRYFLADPMHTGYNSQLKNNFFAVDVKPIEDYDDYLKNYNKYVADHKTTANNNPEPSEQETTQSLKDIMKSLEELKDIVKDNREDRKKVLNAMCSYGNTIFRAIHLNRNNQDQRVKNILTENFNQFKDICKSPYVKHESKLLRNFHSAVNNFAVSMHTLYQAVTAKFTHEMHQNESSVKKYGK